MQELKGWRGLRNLWGFLSVCFFMSAWINQAANTVREWALEFQQAQKHPLYGFNQQIDAALMTFFNKEFDPMDTFYGPIPNIAVALALIILLGVIAFVFYSRARDTRGLLDDALVVGILVILYKVLAETIGGFYQPAKKALLSPSVYLMLVFLFYMFILTLEWKQADVRGFLIAFFEWTIVSVIVNPVPVLGKIASLVEWISGLGKMINASSNTEALWGFLGLLTFIAMISSLIRLQRPN